MDECLCNIPTAVQTGVFSAGDSSAKELSEDIRIRRVGAGLPCVTVSIGDEAEAVLSRTMERLEFGMKCYKKLRCRRIQILRDVVADQPLPLQVPCLVSYVV